MAGSVLLNHGRTFSPAILIPVYNHEHAIADTLNALLPYGYPVLLVDDGSHTPCKMALRELRQQFPQQVFLLRLAENRGKGAAVKAGLFWLGDQGYSHALQIDADGQHDASATERFMAQAREMPQAIITGYAVYDASVPAVRYYGRFITHALVWLNTLSTQIKDTMCGFRVYPIAPVTALCRAHGCGNRMEFDTEVMVRWSWREGAVINVPTQVHYPAGGVSHFRMLKDNLLLTSMHLRLTLGMLWRLPWLLRRRVISDRAEPL